MSGISLPKSLADTTRDRLVRELELTEQPGADSGPWMSLESHAPMAQGVIGEVHRYTGGGLLQLVTCSIVVPQIGLDSHMLFAFTPSETAVPHFTLDSVGAGGHCAFHLDLIPRLDLGANLAYMDEVFTPLTDACKAGRAIEGLSAAQLDPRQNAVMSPWMLAHRATPEAFGKIDETVTAYLDHWLGLLRNGVSSAVLDDVGSESLARRDARNKAIIFDPAVDKVWSQIGGLIGEQSALALRNLLTMCG